MRNLSFYARYPENGYRYLREDDPQAYGALSEQVYGPVYDPAFGLKEQVLDGALYGKVDHHEST